MDKINKNELKWLLILAGFTLYILKLLFTKDIYLFVHPKMIKYIQFSCFVFVLLTFYQAKKVLTVHKQEGKKIAFGVFLIPLLLGFFINPQGLDGTLVASKGVASSLNANKSPSTVQINLKGNGTQNNLVSNKEVSITTTDSSVLDITSSNFIKTTDDINNDVKKFKGKKISITGFVYKDPSLNENEFLVARLSIMCCAADAGVIGLISEYTEANSLRNNQWVKISGILEYKNRTYKGIDQLVPVLKAEKSEPVERPKDQYVYPY